MMTEEARRNFIRANTKVQSPPLVPELHFFLASDDLPLWQAGEDELERYDLPAPFWAFAWAGGQALARYVTDNPETVKNKRVLDFGAGSAIAGIAAAKAGAAHVLCSEIDPWCEPAIQLNAEENNVCVAVTLDDLVGKPSEWDVILAADICYENAPARLIADWLEQLAKSGTDVLVGDPGRTYFPQDRFTRIAHYQVKTDSRVEDTDLRNAGVWRFKA